MIAKDLNFDLAHIQTSNNASKAEMSGMTQAPEEQAISGNAHTRRLAIVRALYCGKAKKIGDLSPLVGYAHYNTLL